MKISSFNLQLLKRLLKICIIRSIITFIVQNSKGKERHREVSRYYPSWLPALVCSLEETILAL